MIRILAATAFASAAVLSAPLSAQDESERVNMVIVYGDDDCPESSADEIIVCARQAESERFRIPETLRFSDSPANTAWAERVESFEMIGSFGTLSCSPTGAGGITGCTQEMIRQAYGEKRTGSNVRFSELIAAAREDRLSTIDEDAAAEQARVEQIERQYMERLERERQAEEAGPDADALPTPE